MIRNIYIDRRVSGVVMLVIFLAMLVTFLAMPVFGLVMPST